MSIKMRSKLFLPCSRPELFNKALVGPADAISFDLENPAFEAGKASIRTASVKILGSDDFPGTDKTMIVRLRAPSIPRSANDVAALAICPVHLDDSKMQTADTL